MGLDEIGVIFICYFFGNMLIGYILEALGLKIKTSWGKDKFKDRKTPIYRLEKGSWYKNGWGIRKYEIGYSQYNDHLITLLIPFGLIINTLQYVRVEDGISLNYPFEELSGDENLGEMYEEIIAFNKANYDKSEKERLEKLKPLEKLNKEFNENYI